MNDPLPTAELLRIHTHALSRDTHKLSLDANGIPILDEVVEDQVFDELAADLQAHLLLELEPQLQDMVRRAFTDTVRVVALDLKHAFERELNQQLDTRLRVLVEESVQRACQRARVQ